MLKYNLMMALNVIKNRLGNTEKKTQATICIILAIDLSPWAIISGYVEFRELYHFSS